MLRSTTLSSKRLIMNDFTRLGFPCVLKFYYYSLAVESFVNTRLNRGGRTTRTCFEVLVRAKPAEAVRVVRDHIDGTYSRVRELSYETTGNPVPTSTRPSLLALETAIVPEPTPATPCRTRSVPLRRTVDRVDGRSNWPVPFTGQAVLMGWGRDPQIGARQGDDLAGAPVADLTSYHR